IMGGAMMWYETKLQRSDDNNVEIVENISPLRNSAIPQFLISSQEASGGWNPARFGGKAEFDKAVSAVATLALLESPEPDSATWRSVHRATEFFRASQTPAGFIGDGAPASPQGLASHALVASALLKAYQTGNFPGLFTVVDGAVQFIRDSQKQNGVWCADAGVNRHMTAALAAAADLGWRDNAGRLRRAVAALNGSEVEFTYGWLASASASRAGGEILTRSLSVISP
ncbi:MAG: hypothetical protein FWG05_04090, partial [Kiritimatiellaeota bacterium]|nr:hypothetical protein [Kiritimatiellota bacterium]